MCTCTLNPATKRSLYYVHFFTAHSGIAWSFRFPSMGTLQNLGTSSRRRKRDGGLVSSDSCKDIRQKRHTIHLQPEVIIQREPCLIVTPPSPDHLTGSRPGYVQNIRVSILHFRRTLYVHFLIYNDDISDALCGEGYSDAISLDVIKR